MSKPNLSGLNPDVAKKLEPMLDDLLAAHGQNIHSIHVVGSAADSDYDERVSNVNSVVVLNAMDLRFVEFLAPLGKQYGKKKIAAPLVMTPDYIQSSLDVFPVEFSDFMLIHQTVYGEDLFAGLTIDKHHLRLQCEREVKTKLIGLRQGYISSMGKRDLLADTLVRSITGSMPFFRATISLLGKEPPLPRTEVVNQLCSVLGIDIDVFPAMLQLKAGTIKPSEQELRVMFERYYTALEATGKIIDDLTV